MSFGRDDSFGFLSNNKEDEKCTFENNTSIMDIPFEKRSITFSKNLGELENINPFAEEKSMDFSLEMSPETIFDNNKKKNNDDNIFCLNPITNTHNIFSNNNNSHNYLSSLNTNLNNFEINKPYAVTDLKRAFILEKLKSSLETLSRIMRKKLLNTRYNAYAKLKTFLYTRKINYTKAELIFSNFQNLFKNLIKIKVNFNRKRLIKHLNHWRLVAQFNQNLQLIKDEIKQSVAGKYRKKIEESEKTKTLKENEIAKVKNEIAKNTEIEASLSSKSKEFEDKEYLILQSIQKLENEKKHIEEEIFILANEKVSFNSNRKEKGFNTYSSVNPSNKENEKDKEFSLSPNKVWNINVDFSSNYLTNNNGNNQGRRGSQGNSVKNNLNNNNNAQSNANKNVKGKKEILLGLEKKISEYERKIQKLTEANLSKDSQITSYMKEMNEIISKHEKTLSSCSSFNTADISKDDIADKNTKIYSAKTSLRASNSYISNNFSTFNTMKNNIVYKNNTNNNSVLSSNLMISPNPIIVNNNFSSQPNSVRNSVINNNPYRLSNFPSFANSKNESLSNNFNANNALSNSNVFNFGGSFGNNFNINLNANSLNQNIGKVNYSNNGFNSINNSNIKASYLLGNENANSYSNNGFNYTSDGNLNGINVGNNLLKK